MIGRIEPYLNFKGNAKEALDFYAKVFELDPPSLMTMADMPREDQKDMKDTLSDDQIMHGSVDFNGTFLMASDTIDEMFEEGEPIEGNKYYLSWSTQNPDDVRTVWDRFVKDGSTIVMPLEETFWASLYGILKDPYGVQWMIQVWDHEEADL